jgi:hypothetical protein
MRKLTYFFCSQRLLAVALLFLWRAADAQLRPCPETNSSSSSLAVHECSWQTKATPAGQLDLKGVAGAFLPVLVVQGNRTLDAQNSSAGTACSAVRHGGCGSCCAAPFTRWLHARWLHATNGMQEELYSGAHMRCTCAHRTFWTV